MRNSLEVESKVKMFQHYPETISNTQIFNTNNSNETK